MSDTSREHYDDEITSYLRNAVDSQSNNQYVVIKEFEKSMVPIESEIKQARIEKREVYGLTSNVMRLLESTIILNPKINKERKYFIMECFKHLNEHQLEVAKKQLLNAYKKPEFVDIIPSLSQQLKNQELFNHEYELSIQKQNLTPGLLSLLVTYKKHTPKLVEEYQNPNGSEQSIQEENLPPDLVKLLEYTKYHPELKEKIYNQYGFSKFESPSTMVQGWMKENADEVHNRLYHDGKNFDGISIDKLPPSRMNEVDGGGRKKSKKKRQYKKSKSNRVIKKLKKNKKTKKQKNKKQKKQKKL